MAIQNILLALIATTVLSGIGAIFLALKKENLENIVRYLISLSAGSILGGVFIHLVFRLSNGAGYTRFTGLLVLAGIVGSLGLERIVHWHCHNREYHVEPFSYVLLVGDSVHNILDGVLIASSFLAAPSAGIASTIAVAMHKIPKEAGDFGVLVHAGFSKYKAVGFNIGLSSFMFFGAAIVIALTTITGNIVNLLLPLVIGNFVYIAGSDLLPEFKDSDDELLKHMVVFSVGVLIMYSIPYVRTLFV